MIINMTQAGRFCGESTYVAGCTSALFVSVYDMLMHFCVHYQLLSGCVSVFVCHSLYLDHTEWQACDVRLWFITVLAVVSFVLANGFEAVLLATAVSALDIL